MKNPLLVPAPRLVYVESNPGPRESRRLSEEEWRLSTELHLNPTAIAERLGVHRHTVSAILSKYHETKTIRDRPRSGRKRKISTEDEKKIGKKAKQGKDAIEIAREYERETKIKVDRTIVGRLIHDHKFKWLIRQQVQELTAANKANHLAYARAMSKYNWKRVLFSDEKNFYLGAMKTRHPPKINVWAGAGAYMKTKLYFFKENMVAPLYR